VLKGFREFFLRGNVLHLSAAVIIGTAFTAMATAVVSNWIGPLIAAIGGHNPNGLAVTLVTGNDRSVMNFGAILTALIVFAIIVVVVYYLIVLPVKEMQLRRAWASRSRPPEPTELELLADIRGLLHQQLSQHQGIPVVPNGQMTRLDDGGRSTVEVNQGFSSRLVVLPGDKPGLVINYAGRQVAFSAGRDVSAVVNAHEFAVGLAYTALAFAGRCRVQMAPQSESA
jgi:large conductance mechanosensitive channel